MSRTPIPTLRTLIRLGSIGIVSSLLLAGFVAADPQTTQPYGGESNLWVEWEDKGIPVVLPSVGWRVDGAQLGCAGTVRLTFADGSMRTLAGAALGPEACTEGNDPCFPYTEAPQVVVGCEADDAACCLLFELPDDAEANLASLALGCLWPFFVAADLDGDGTTDVRHGPFFGFAGC